VTASPFLVEPTWRKERPRRFKSEREAFAYAGWNAAQADKPYLVRLPDGTAHTVGEWGTVGALT
jgi:hypothetical protein